MLICNYSLLISKVLCLIFYLFDKLIAVEHFMSVEFTNFKVSQAQFLYKNMAVSQISFQFSELASRVEQSKIKIVSIKFL